jgi:hypothetical protein
VKLTEFIESLSFETFNVLRVAVISRHQRHAKEMAMVLEYLMSQPSLCKAAFTSREACENVLAEKTGVEQILVVKSVDRFIDIVEQMKANNAELPFMKEQADEEGD